ncbi:MAG: hypothetical protein U0414_24035 [Polyangiaceae bacterium]
MLDPAPRRSRSPWSSGHRRRRRRALELLWYAPPGCPDQGSVLADIARLSTRTGVGADATTISGVVLESDRGWAVELSMARGAAPARHRHVEGSSCREVSDAAAVIVALALDTAAAEADEPPPPPTKPKTSTPEAPRTSPPTAPTPPAPAPSLPIGWRLVAFGGVDFAALPTPSPGGGVSGGITFGRNRVTLRASAWAPRPAYLASSASGADVGLYVGAAQYCRVLVLGVVGLSACGAIEAGALVAESFGLRQDGAGTSAWFAPELSLSTEIHAAKHFTAALDVSGLVPTIRDNFTVDADVVYRTSVIDGRVTLSIGFEAP